MTDQDTIAAVSDAWMRAIATNSTQEIEQFMMDEWLLITPEAGPVTKGQFLDAIDSGALVHDDMRSEGEPQVRVYGDTAVLVSHVTNRGRYQDQPFTYNEWSTDTYIKTDGSWRCVLTALTPVAGPPGE